MINALWQQHGVHMLRSAGACKQTNALNETVAIYNDDGLLTYSVVPQAGTETATAQQVETTIRYNLLSEG